MNGNRHGRSQELPMFLDNKGDRTVLVRGMDTETGQEQRTEQGQDRTL